MSFVDDMDYRYFDPNTGSVVGVKYRENSDGSMGHTTSDVSPWKPNHLEPGLTGHYASGNYEDLFQDLARGDINQGGSPRQIYDPTSGRYVPPTPGQSQDIRKILENIRLRNKKADALTRPFAGDIFMSLGFDMYDV
jgi:hypothetical protein